MVTLLTVILKLKKKLTRVPQLVEQVVRFQEQNQYQWWVMIFHSEIMIIHPSQIPPKNLRFGPKNRYFMYLLVLEQTIQIHVLFFSHTNF